MDADTAHEMDRFTPLMIFSSDHIFPEMAADHGIPYKLVIGLYQGIIEDSYVVGMDSCLPIRDSGMLHGQETVLLLTGQEAVFGGHRRAFLVKVTNNSFLEADGEYLGHWHKVSLTEALHCDAWTCYPDDPAWYVTKMPTLEVTP